jgi:hypothetical protein
MSTLAAVAHPTATHTTTTARAVTRMSAAVGRSGRRLRRRCIGFPPGCPVRSGRRDRMRQPHRWTDPAATTRVMACAGPAATSAATYRAAIFTPHSGPAHPLAAVPDGRQHWHSG